MVSTTTVSATTGTDRSYPPGVPRLVRSTPVQSCGAFSGVVRVATRPQGYGNTILGSNR